jgi:predicted GNAT family N-acyltransferase
MIVSKRITGEQELQAAYDVRRKVFVEEQQVPEEEEYDAYDETANHYLASYRGVPCGAARWRETGSGIKLERFAVLAPYRNKAVGSSILQKVLQDVTAEHTPVTIYLHAQLKAVPFYERHGFSKVGDIFTECDIQHYKMLMHA